MRAILGIDAAWTPAEPSGLALVAKRLTGWHLVAVATSYQRFLSLADHSLIAQERPLGSLPEASALLAAASMLCGRAVDLIAVDVPLAHSHVRGRRFSDNAVSKAYGGRKCGTHSPTALRPGAISDALNRDFARAGYLLQTEAITIPGLIEVYPHPGLVELMGASERLPYKALKVRRYWPSITPEERRARLYEQWDKIITSLEGEIVGVAAALPKLELDASGVHVKAYEDALDAVVCAWVGVCALEGRAAPFGNEDSAIWIPRPRVTVATAYDPLASDHLASSARRSSVTATVENLRQGVPDC